ncbi:MAG TPA: hypothetical protein VG895_01235 [Patescibacteria group bacterium]|nr:hypothetical protein [Patescibacteria group bacterium]
MSKEILSQEFLKHASIALLVSTLTFGFINETHADLSPENCSSLLSPNLPQKGEAEVVIPSLDVRDGNLNIVGQLQEGDKINIIYGPICMTTKDEGSLNFYETNYGQYVPDADNSHYFLQDANPQSEIPTAIANNIQDQQPEGIDCPAERDGNLFVMTENEPVIPHITNSKLEEVLNVIAESRANLGKSHYDETVLGFYTNLDDLTKAAGFNIGKSWDYIHSFRTVVYSWSDKKCSFDEITNKGVNFVMIKIPYSPNSNSGNLSAIYFELLEREFANTIPTVNDGPIANNEEEIGRNAYLRSCGKISSDSASASECRQISNIIYSSN